MSAKEIKSLAAHQIRSLPDASLPQLANMLASLRNSACVRLTCTYTETSGAGSSRGKKLFANRFGLALFSLAACRATQQPAGTTPRFSPAHRGGGRETLSSGHRAETIFAFCEASHVIVCLANFIFGRKAGNQFGFHGVGVRG